MASAGLAPTSVWNGKLYSDGWRNAESGTLVVTDKASGERLGEINLLLDGVAQFGEDRPGDRGLR